MCDRGLKEADTCHRHGLSTLSWILMTSAFPCLALSYLASRLALSCQGRVKTTQPQCPGKSSIYMINPVPFVSPKTTIRIGSIRYVSKYCGLTSVNRQLTHNHQGLSLKQDVRQAKLVGSSGTKRVWDQPDSQVQDFQGKTYLYIHYIFPSKTPCSGIWIEKYLMHSRGIKSFNSIHRSQSSVQPPPPT